MIHAFDATDLTLFSIKEPFIEEEISRLKDGFIFIDCGAHVGKYTLMAAGLDRGGKIVAIEPESCNFDRLKYNILLNGLTNIILGRFALANKDGRVRLLIQTESGYHSIVKLSLHSVDVPSRTLDSIIQELETPKVDLVKIDVEGAEYAVLIGGLRSLKMGLIRKIFVEVGNSTHNCDKIIQLLRSCGFLCTRTSLTANWHFVLGVHKFEVRDG
jgi:FkbM family methyltransferase